MKILCCSNMPYANEAFRTLGETVLKDGRKISADDVRAADMLAIRSTTKVTRELLDGSAVRFVGTATIGTDHLDIAYLERAGIRWCYAPGCNANSVSEYVTAALLCLAVRHGGSLEGKTLGVIGVGNVGSRVVNKALALGMRVLPNDPPRQRRGEKVSGVGCEVSAPPLEGAVPPAPRPALKPALQMAERTPLSFVSLDQVLAESDIVTLHVPLTREGPDATVHMAGRSFFERLKPGAIFLNSARGPVTDTDALLRAMDAEIVAHAVIDTWEGEPAFRRDLLDRVDLGTPHIAGYSFDGKVMGTVMVYREACRFLGVEPTWTPDDHLPPPPVPEVSMDCGFSEKRTEVQRVRETRALWEIVRRVYDIEADDRAMREGNSPDTSARAAHFDRLRKGYPVRREFPFTRVLAPGASPYLTRAIRGLGFRTVAGG